MISRTRSGTALLLAMFTVATVAAIVAIAADNIGSLSRQQDLDGDKRRASTAAESVAALVEAKLVALAAEEQKLNSDIASLPSSWWNLRGYCDGIDQNGDGYDDENPPMWFNGCAVRWRLEPVRVFAGYQQETNAGSTSLTNQIFMVNAVADPAQDPARKANAKLFEDSKGHNNVLFENVPGNAGAPQAYNFRIVTEAWALRDVNDITARPWRAPRLAAGRQEAKASIHAQAQRVVQLNRISLFRYALFHAAATPTGDLEMSTGTTLSVAGAVHSNAAIYFYGGDNRGLTSSPVDYHMNSSGSLAPPQESVQIAGTAAGSTTTVTGVAGLFRLSKLGDMLAAKNGIAGASANPWAVPKSGVGGMTGINDLNGDSVGSARHTINNKAFHCGNDSRTLTGAGGMQATFNGLVLDSQNGGKPVNTLANIPQLGGRPFEAQQICGSVPLYTTSPGTPLDATAYTIDQTRVGATPLYYDRSPLLAGASPTAVVTAFPITATDMPLFWTDAAHTTRDVTTALANNPASVGDGDAGFNSNEVKSWYLEKALYDANTTMIPDSTSGLVIRERPAQINWANPANGSNALIPFTPYTNFGTTLNLAQRDTLATYLKQQYVVYFAGRNITDAFFNDIINIGAGNVAYASLICGEDEFVDARESLHMWRFYPAINVQNFGGAGQPPYRQNVLTINMQRLQQWLQATPLTAFGSASVAKANTLFNGLLYVARTRRAATYHPINNPALLWSQVYDSGTYTNPVIANLAQVRNGVGPVETQRTHVRIRSGADMTLWNKVAAGGYVPSNKRGLTFVTPDRLYAWGDYNTWTDGTFASVPTPPCALYADGIVALSNSWTDVNNQAFAMTTNAVHYSGTDASSTTYNASLVTNNVPTESWNAESGGTGGCSNMVRFLENWTDSGAIFHLKGSAVVMNAQRYSKAALAYAFFDLHMWDPVYKPPQRDIKFNTDLLLASGLPPFSPYGVQITRVVGFVNSFEN